MGIPNLGIIFMLERPQECNSKTIDNTRRVLKYNSCTSISSIRPADALASAELMSLALLHLDNENFALPKAMKVNEPCGNIQSMVKRYRASHYTEPVSLGVCHYPSGQESFIKTPGNFGHTGFSKPLYFTRIE